ncbi:hypothetical protein SH528x_001219 [Novipirellula sp. SH528]|uniref:hypothetical protein n=1 Tax=Novipirellula sp. SH528 TaxID=3454466 RepID=UPI003FA11407
MKHANGLESRATIVGRHRSGALSASFPSWNRYDRTFGAWNAGTLASTFNREARERLGKPSDNR